METLPATTPPPNPALPPPSATKPAGWGLLARTAFRFLFAYWFLYTFATAFTLPLSIFRTVVGRTVSTNPAEQPEWVQTVNLASKPLEWLGQGTTAYTIWACRTFLGVETAVPTDPSGSGDRQFMYCSAFADLTLAIGAGLIWTVASELWAGLRTRRRPGYDRMNALFRLLLRTHLMVQMIVYGAMKVWCAQFPPIRDFQLETKYGDSSPMGLLWRFMEFSQPYTSFTGVVETVCGLLLICRRTTLLGALLSTVAMGQVFLLNMCYDVPVKLMSGHLLLTAVILVAQDWRKLLHFFVLAKPVAATPLPALFVKWKWCHRVGLVLRTLLFVGFAAVTLEEQYAAARKGGILSTPSGYVGRWVGVEFERDGEVIPVPEQPANPPPTQFKPSQWAGEPGMQPVIRASVQAQFAAFVFTDNTLVSYTQSADTADELILTRRGETAPTARLHVSFPEPNRMVLEGPFGQQQVKITLRRIEEPKREYALKSKGFNWIQEFPDNR